MKTASMKRDLISRIIVDKSNFEYITKTGIINGTLLIEIERVMEQYHESRMKEIPEITDEEIKIACPQELIKRISCWIQGAKWYREEQRKRMTK